MLRTRDDETRLKYRRISNKVRTLTRKAERQKERRIAEDIKDNPKKFWRHVRSQSKYKPKIPDLQMPGGGTTSSNREKAATLADFFASVFTEEPEDDLDEISNFCDTEMSEMYISDDDVRNELKKMDITKSPGPDSIQPRVLKEAGDILAVPLGIIIRESLRTGQLPEDWKTAHIAAIYKKGDKSQPENYRPVRLTSVACNTMERIIREGMMAHMKSHRLFSDQQYGFINGRSTTLQLITVLDDWTEILDQGGTIDVTYCDFRKAFDKVPHRRLLQKVSAYGFRGRILTWLTSFLLGRQQRVHVGGDSSEWHPVHSGILQGSLMGPLLFVLYVNDLPRCVAHSLVYLFADDLKVFRSIRIPKDSRKLQDDIDQIYKWAEHSLLQLHPEKCITMTVGAREDPGREYTMKDGQIKLRAVDKEKDIGVTIDNQLKFREHMNDKVQKANRLLGLIWRSFEYKDQKMMLLLYKSLIRPNLEYANQAWAPYKKKDIETLENIQRRATRMMPGLRGQTYEERLQHLKLPTLAFRRLRGEMVELFKMTSGLYEPSLLVNRLQPAAIVGTRGHSQKLMTQSPGRRPQALVLCKIDRTMEQPLPTRDHCPLTQSF